MHNIHQHMGQVVWTNVYQEVNQVVDVMDKRQVFNVAPKFLQNALLIDTICTSFIKSF